MKSLCHNLREIPNMSQPNAFCFFYFHSLNLYYPQRAQYTACKKGNLGRKAGPSGGRDEPKAAGIWFRPLSGTKAFRMEKGGAMPIHGKLLMTLPFKGISETASDFSFCPPFSILKT